MTEISPILRIPILFSPSRSNGLDYSNDFIKIGNRDLYTHTFRTKRVVTNLAGINTPKTVESTCHPASPSPPTLVRSPLHPSFPRLLPMPDPLNLHGIEHGLSRCPIQPPTRTGLPTLLYPSQLQLHRPMPSPVGPELIPSAYPCVLPGDHQPIPVDRLSWLISRVDELGDRAALWTGDEIVSSSR